MKKGTFILSIILTGVVLALLVMLVSTYKKTVETAVLAETTQVQEQTQTQQPAQSTPNLVDAAAAGRVRIFDAAAIAANVLRRDDVYITEYAQFNGADAYLVTFLSGDLVYVSLDGEVVSTSKQNPVAPYQPTSHR
jgi:hypothetical protein